MSRITVFNVLSIILIANFSAYFDFACNTKMHKIKTTHELNAEQLKIYNHAFNYYMEKGFLEHSIEYKGYFIELETEYQLYFLPQTGIINGLNGEIIVEEYLQVNISKTDLKLKEDINGYRGFEFPSVKSDKLKKTKLGKRYLKIAMDYFDEIKMPLDRYNIYITESISFFNEGTVNVCLISKTPSFGADCGIYISKETMSVIAANLEGCK